ncbi:DNA repair protein RecN [Stomatobaculum longum]|uniref:DNA repair protein RecN n=1 Tax=Stomatobaculum longum TaxID=796942 RepID=A0AA36Y685_9FIRM|nr:DNA repair protein RecN [Stomatobaculum longum]EHO17701.1 DNA repair protein RecN [Stomatobaculum longum]
MLLGLRVKNFALIREASLSFDTGFTVLSGETGAGKSILIDSISALLGAKTGRDMIRNGEEAAYLELIFSVRQKELRERLAALSIVPEEDGTVIVSRKIQKTRSISRINGEAVTARQLKELAALLIDIHGQHEVQTLFSTEMHGRLLDELLPPAGQAAREAYAEAYRAYRQLLRQERESADRAALLREADLLAFEIRELSESGIHPGEEAELAEAYASAKHAAQIEEALAEAERALQTDAVSEALRAVRAVVRYATSLEALAGQLTELDALVQDAAEAVRGEQGKVESDEETLNRLGERLDLLRHLEAKYDCDEEGLLRLLEQKEARAAAITALLRSAETVTQQKESARQTLCAAAAALREFRHRAAESLATRVETELAALNFKGARFEVRFAELADFAESAEFYIRTNPGEEIKPLRQIASGGELSRVMLALQTVLAAKDRVETLIFDEIDAGISGRTAQLVSEKLMEISRTRQVLCITHLPQLAAMADHHYLIAKETDGSKTETEIREITGEALYLELGRLIGGAEITAGVLKTAEEMKQLAEKRKEEMR